MQCGRSTRYTKSVPCDHFCSQLAEGFLCGPVDILGDDVDWVRTSSTFFSEFCPFHFQSKLFQIQPRSTLIISKLHTHLAHHDLIRNGPLIFQMGDSHPSMANNRIKEPRTTIPHITSFNQPSIKQKSC
eukprot:TRINITY_DN6398_c0_g1_i5.p1 TRINITY_DN6398_c0_g1~~TRINITY_DN6398_c0_g1_i5.p1  ORF type:complete len:129 (+),score=7.09 TRINITY_DN6398_c0_g1_i5:398-784(+)